MATPNTTPTISEIQVTLLRASGLAAVIGYAEIARDYVNEDPKFSPAPCDFRAASEALIEVIYKAQEQLERLERGSRKMGVVA
ncbi:hypothetical protein VSS37_18570 [Candidatus Thiothrix sp. Deng01]|uniref:Uncharacterized protein n=1 Tax=Candidatus Thiothrix phosphatis TaxID=3112415 RepID=A0ABU6D1R0_9GAMM|nr:hypothetical protein [Candidatus Thiothrix sp. Deng01]MEB4592991.1 hypothetical protein [Candidatus Thiothrix sp. Deng01]